MQDRTLFMPLHPEDEDEYNYKEDGYMPLTNDWYDLPCGQCYVYFCRQTDPEDKWERWKR